MEEIMKLVEFEKWCETCKHLDKEPTDDPCNECLGEPARQYSHKPLKWEEK